MVQQKIVVFGSIVQDLISYTDRFPRPGESVRGTGFFAGCGGKGANQAVAAAKLGVDVSMIARVGDDMFGELNTKGLRSSGVNVDAVEKCKAPTATATITVNSEGENNIVVMLGANMELKSDVADRHENEIASASLVLAQAEVSQEGNRRMFEIARKHNVRTFFNPAPGDPDLDKSVLKLVDILCTNENEAEFITGIEQTNAEDAQSAARKMLEMGPRHVIITLGSKGVILASSDAPRKVEQLDVHKVNAVDTTGAGDCFVGSLAALLVRKVEIRKAVQCAANLAALSVTRKGTQASYWSIEEIKEKHPHLLKDLSL